MNNEPLHRLLRSLRHWGEQADSDALSDAELLERFRTWRDQAAFELLLWRHGPMVLGVCRRLLPTAQDAEDAFQAVWLTFVRKARSIARGGALGGWLHQVACRVALRARAGLARRARRERDDVEQLGFAQQSTAEIDLAAVLDEEVNRLPARQRLAFVLCCLEGKSGEEAARQLGCAPGTVSSRLTRAREQLRRRLTRRGLVPAVALVAAAAGEALAAPLIQSTMKACLLFSAGRAAGGELSARSVTLAEGVLRAMFLSKLKIVAVLLLAVGVLATSRTFSQRPVEAAPPEEAKQESPPAKEKPQEKKEKPIFVEVVKPQKGGVDRKTTGACSVQAFQTAEITAQVSGLLKNFSVDIGDRVRMGQLLAEIDAPLTDLEEKQASSAVKQASGQLQVVRAGIEGARAKVNAAKAMVVQRQAELDRAQAIVTFRKRQLDAIKTDPGVPRGTVTEKEQQAEEARGDVLAARAALDRARADVLVREGEVAAAEAAVEAAQGGLEVARVSLARAQLMRERTRITAPIAGIVTGVEHRSGQVLAPEGRGPCLLHLMRTDSMRVVTQVTEQFVPSTRVGLPVKLAFDALPGVPFSDCKVSRIGYILDEKTRTMRVEIDVPNPQQKLRPGMSGWAEILLQKGSPKALRLSTSCVRFVGNREHVFVVRDGKARLTAVKVGFGDGEQIEVLSGLEPAERVILSPAATLREGDPVEIKKERSPE